MILEFLVTHLLGRWFQFVQIGKLKILVVTKKSQTLQGYERASRDENKILLRDFAGGGMHRISRDDIEKVEKIGSLMPPTAQILSKNDIADLLAYLFSLRG